jgi:hypothetical protein
LGRTAVSYLVSSAGGCAIAVKNVCTLVDVLEKTTEKQLNKTGFVELEWTDELIQSELTSAGITTVNLTLSQDDVWMPIIIMTNSVEDLVRVGHTSVPVVLKPDGGVYWKTNFDMEIYCTVDATYYPFDTHSCKITFLPWQNIIL